MKPLIAIVGNTGAGKSQFAVELAKALNGEIINGDAMQMYQGLDTITNKHPPNEQGNIPHHLMGFEPWDSQLTVQDFERMAIPLVSRIHDNGKIPILVGGTHYYIQSLLVQNALINSNSTKNNNKQGQFHEFTAEQQQILDDAKSVETTLKSVDPTIAAKFHPNDTRRLRRALEIWFETGRKPSEIYESQMSGSDAQKQKLRYRVLVFWVWCNRTVLNNRLDVRVSSMIDNGLMKEIQEMHQRYQPENCQTGIWQVLGFRQFLPYCEKPTQENYQAGFNSMQNETRQYASKQTKWIRNKLGPLIDSLGGSFALIDTTDLIKWDEAKDRGIKIATEWLKNLPATEPLIPDHLSEEVSRKRQSYDRTQWTRHHCDECSKYKNADVVLMGDDDWKRHLASKSHRAIIRKMKSTVE